MEKQNFETCIEDLVREIINCISEKEYDELEQIALIDAEWIEEDEEQSDGFRRFEEWIEDQLSGWKEETGEDFVIDSFDKAYLEIEFDEENENCALATYTPTSDEEDIDMWFEFRCIVDNDDKVTVTVNVNM